MREFLDGNTAIALPHDRLRELLPRYGRGPDSPGD